MVCFPQYPFYFIEELESFFLADYELTKEKFTFKGRLRTQGIPSLNHPVEDDE